MRPSLVANSAFNNPLVPPEMRLSGPIRSHLKTDVVAASSSYRLGTKMATAGSSQERAGQSWTDPGLFAEEQSWPRRKREDLLPYARLNRR